MVAVVVGAHVVGVGFAVVVMAQKPVDVVAVFVVAIVVVAVGFVAVAVSSLTSEILRCRKRLVILLTRSGVWVCLSEFLTRLLVSQHRILSLSRVLPL